MLLTGYSWYLVVTSGYSLLLVTSVTYCYFPSNLIPRFIYNENISWIKIALHVRDEQFNTPASSSLIPHKVEFHFLIVGIKGSKLFEDIFSGCKAF